MSNPLPRPDFMKVKLLDPKNQNGETSRNFQSSHGIPGTIVNLSYSVGLALIQSGQAEEVKS
jgi:hypothetical protein